MISLSQSNKPYGINLSSHFPFTSLLYVTCFPFKIYKHFSTNAHANAVISSTKCYQQHNYVCVCGAISKGYKDIPIRNLTIKTETQKNLKVIYQRAYAVLGRTEGSYPVPFVEFLSSSIERNYKFVGLINDVTNVKIKYFFQVLYFCIVTDARDACPES